MVLKRSTIGRSELPERSIERGDSKSTASVDWAFTRISP